MADSVAEEEKNNGSRGKGEGERGEGDDTLGCEVRDGFWCGLDVRTPYECGVWRGRVMMESIPSMWRWRDIWSDLGAVSSSWTRVMIWGR